jgi:hypothetical protein
MTLLQFSRDKLRAITVGKASDKKDDEPSETVDRVSTAVADGIVTELYKVIDELRATAMHGASRRRGLHSGRRCDGGGRGKSACGARSARPTWVMRRCCKCATV